MSGERSHSEQGAMLASSVPADDEVRQLRQDNYNAELAELIPVHEELRILRVVPDQGVPVFDPGQYTVLGLGYWEPRFEGSLDETHSDSELRKLCKRAYSMSCSMLDDRHRLLPANRCSYLEFYVVLIPEAEDHPPDLTPRLFALKPGDRLFVGPKVTGRYTLEGVQPEDDCVFVATGTGEAPHNVMIAHLLSTGHRGRLVAVTCARQLRDLAYLHTHRALEKQFANYRHVTLTTREPQNLNPQAPHFIGKRHLQDYFESGDFERDADLSLDPERTHVFLCGNPAMIGVPLRSAEGERRYPKPKGMVEVLERRGFRTDAPRQPGNVHFEKYW